MSRTDKTKPWLVRVAEHHPWADHNHDDGICDLPASPLIPNPYGDRINHCRWSDWNICRDGCCNGCGCRTCSGYHERKQERRRARHQARLKIKAAKWDAL